MPDNTIAINRQMTHFDQHQSVWLFGYGSLIYKADFPYIERRPASIRHWVRRFWQGSHDHRGTPDAPGRVVTLIPQQDAVCEGMAYLITPEEFAHLDYREKNGYLRLVTDIRFHPAGKTEKPTERQAEGPEEGETEDRVEGVVYIAAENNAAFLGEAEVEDIARQIAQSHGPSGSNMDYLLRLASALRELNALDEHVFAIEAALMQMEPELGHA